MTPFHPLSHPSRTLIMGAHRLAPAPVRQEKSIKQKTNSKKGGGEAARRASVLGGRPHASLPVLPVALLEHVVAAELGAEAGADEEGPAHLAVQRIGFLRGRGQPLLQHDGDEVVDALRGRLGAEVEGLDGRERLAQDHHGVHVGVDHRLGGRGRERERERERFNHRWEFRMSQHRLQEIS